MSSTSVRPHLRVLTPGTGPADLQGGARGQGNGMQVTKQRSLMGIDVRQLRSGRGVEIRVSGVLDERTVGDLRPLLLDPAMPSPKVLLNLSGVESVDPAGMALMMMARVELEATGIRFVVESSEPKLTRSLMAAGLPRFVTIAVRRLDALRALGEEAEPEAVVRDLTSAPALAADA
jgi:anti-anti-sigma factor